MYIKKRNTDLGFCFCMLSLLTEVLLNLEPARPCRIRNSFAKFHFLVLLFLGDRVGDIFQGLVSTSSLGLGSSVVVALDIGSW